MINVRAIVCDIVDPFGFDILRNKGITVDYMPEIKANEMIKLIENYDVIITRSRIKIGKEIIEKGSKLKIIARAGTGLDNIDLKAARSKGITILNTPGMSKNAVAELVIGLMICLCRNILNLDRHIKKNRILKNIQGSEIKGKTLGIIGMGKIGTEVALIAEGLGMKVLGYTHNFCNFKKLYNVTMTDFDDLLKRSDFISIHLPLTTNTYHMIDIECFSKMKSTAFFINTARGKIVNEKDLYNALINRQISGAALDVFELEPPINVKLINLKNVIATPHIGAQTKEIQKNISVKICQQIINNINIGII